MAWRVAVIGLLLIACLGVGIHAGEMCTGEYRNEYCVNGCCHDICCQDDRDSGVSHGGLIGLIIGVVILKVFLWTCCCYVRYRRRQTILVRRVVMCTPQTPAQLTPVSNNPAHAGYNQPGGSVPPPYTDLTEKPSPPPHSPGHDFPSPV